jgi:hypothetical protein
LLLAFVESTTTTEFPTIYANFASTVNDTLPPNSGAGTIETVVVVLVL